MKIWPIYKREVRQYFTSPVAYVILAIFLFITGLFFYAIFSGFAQASMQIAMNPGMGRDLNVMDSVLRPLFDNMRVILLLLMPLVTMRLFAEERRSGTIELLLTYPVRDGAVLVGKYLAAMTLYAAMIAGMLAYPAMLAYFARVELFASSLTENQIVAAIVTFGVLLSFWIIGWLAAFVSGPVGAVLTHLSILEHNDTFAKGVLDTKDVIYYVDFTALALFLALRSLEARRWSG
jgi:ABC-2 type transport system permease protein